MATAPPLLSIEAYLHTSYKPDVLADYPAMGVPHIWLIDLIRRMAFTYDAIGLHFVDIAYLTITGTPARIDLTQAFVQLDRKAAGKRTGSLFGKIERWLVPTQRRSSWKPR
jgi:hypothetical protein